MDGLACKCTIAHLFAIFKDIFLFKNAEWMCLKLVIEPKSAHIMQQLLFTAFRMLSDIEIVLKSALLGH